MTPTMGRFRVFVMRAKEIIHMRFIRHIVTSSIGNVRQHVQTFGLAGKIEVFS
jgi:hypothetical protein